VVAVDGRERLSPPPLPRSPRSRRFSEFRSVPKLIIERVNKPRPNLSFAAMWGSILTRPGVRTLTHVRALRREVLRPDDQARRN